MALTSAALTGCGSARPASSPQAPGNHSGPATTTVAPAVPTSEKVRGTPPPLEVAANSTWSAYHANQSRTAAVAAGAALDPIARAWTVDLGGAVHGQPVVADDRIFAATETNRVVALSPRSGRILWSVSLGPPLTNVDAVAGCGDIDPLGVTSTPVVDEATRTVYVVAEVSSGGGVVHHQLEGLDATTGAVKLSVDVDPPLPAGERTVQLLQRAALAVGHGRVYVGYGGNFGDCGHYHGWLVGVDPADVTHEVSFEVASDGEGGAIWQAGGAPALDGHGDIYVTTGNANPDPPEGGPDPKAYTESVVKLTPGLKPLASFKDTVAGGDEDLSTGNPVLLPDGDMFAVGKTDIGYVLAQRSLRQIAAIHGVCGSDPDGGPAYDRTLDRIFVPCEDGGIQEVDLATMSLGPRLSGANGPPILVGRDLWAVQYPTGAVVEYDAATGTTLQTIDVGGDVASFTSPSTALGLILVPTDTGVTALDGPGGLPVGL